MNRWVSGGRLPPPVVNGTRLRAIAVVIATAIGAAYAVAQTTSAPMPASATSTASTPVAPAAPIAPSKPTAPTIAKPATVPTLKIEASPVWSELTPVQQGSLKPLSTSWADLGEGQKRKWLEVSKSYQSLPTAEQAKMHSRMAEWAALSPKQRAQARLNFAETKVLSPSDKAANWQAYQALSAEEKQKLANQAAPKHNSAAVDVKPVAPDKLAPVPVTRKTVKTAEQLASPTPTVNKNTLLPLPQATAAPASAPKN
jgi:hypothetical protein